MFNEWLEEECYYQHLITHVKFGILRDKLMTQYQILHQQLQEMLPITEGVVEVSEGQFKKFRERIKKANLPPLDETIKRFGGLPETSGKV